MRPYNTRGASKLPVFSPRHQQQVDDYVEELTPQQSQPMRSKRWTDSQKFMLVWIVQEHNEHGQLAGEKITSLVWTEMTTIFNYRMNLNRTTQQLKDAWRNLKRDFYRYRDLSSKTGWRWNYDLNILDASDELWDELIQANPTYKSMRRPFPLYGLLQNLNLNTYAVGHHVQGSSYPDIMTNLPSPQVKIEEAQEEDTFTADYVFTEKPQGNFKVLPPKSNTRSIKRSSSDEPTLPHDTLTAHRRRRTGKGVQSDVHEDIARHESCMQKKFEKSDPYSYQAAINKLNTLKDLSSGGYNALTIIFQENADMCTAFMLLPTDRLKGWVEYVINLEKKGDDLPLWAD